LTHSPRGTVLSLIHRARMKMQNYLMDGDYKYRDDTLVKFKGQR